MRLSLAHISKIQNGIGLPILERCVCTVVVLPENDSLPFGTFFGLLISFCLIPVPLGFVIYLVILGIALRLVPPKLVHRYNYKDRLESGTIITLNLGAEPEDEIKAKDSCR